MACQHVNKTARVSSHRDLGKANAENQPHASVLVCSRPECEGDARVWVAKQAKMRLTDVVVIQLKKTLRTG